MRQEVYCNSSRALCTQRAGAVRRSRTTRSGQELRSGNGSSVLYVREVQYARGRSREVFGCEPVEGMGAVYSRADRKVSTRMQGECMGGEYVHVKTESYRHRYKLESVGKEGR